MRFKEYLKETTETQVKILTLLYLAENDSLVESYDIENLSEMQKELLTESIKSWLEKVGLSIEKGSGLIDYVTQFSIGVGKIILAAIKGDKDEVKKIAKKVTKEKVLDFLLKLDLITLHIVTEPIHIIDDFLIQ